MRLPGRHVHGPDDVAMLMLLSVQRTTFFFGGCLFSVNTVQDIIIVHIGHSTATVKLIDLSVCLFDVRIIARSGNGCLFGFAR